MADRTAEGRRAKLASRNEHKLRELAQALPGWRIELVDTDDFPAEEGQSYYENARAKARFGRGAVTGDVWLLGEDSGLEVDALGGRPGLRSARWASPGEDAVEKLLRELEGVVDEARGARYVCELVCLSPQLQEFRGTGLLEGRIAREPRGREGFGYDPVFVPAGETQTVAELGDAWKVLRSHRARAARALLDALAAAQRSGDAGSLLQGDVPAPAPPGPVDLGPEDDQVRHQVQPDEQERRAAERLERDHVVGEP